MRSNRYPWLLLAALVPGAHAQPPADPQAMEHDARVAAADYALTSRVTLEESLQQRCGTLTGGAGKRARSAFTAWLKRNAVAMHAADLQLQAMTSAVSAHRGPAEARAFQRARVDATVARAAHANAALFPAGVADPALCDMMVARLGYGEGDLLRHPEFGPTLERIASESD